MKADSTKRQISSFILVSSVLPCVTDGSVGAGGPFTHGDIVIVSCNAGFLPLGNNFFTCACDGFWSGKPSCVRREVIKMPYMLWTLRKDTYIGPLFDGAVVAVCSLMCMLIHCSLYLKPRVIVINDIKTLFQIARVSSSHETANIKFHFRMRRLTECPRWQCGCW
ncbi:hypothetical protein DPMN_059158 [Dreissena polymorpha]|uniref:Sushi domain-containing protein n=1 Tax=Dreissena polymorpha TaxID=45954 RepID=A0A9D4HEN6_DREPO|nr:hypothetical protein DPMN_059158 [Dreissena polymorpha]